MSKVSTVLAMLVFALNANAVTLKTAPKVEGKVKTETNKATEQGAIGQGLTNLAEGSKAVESCPALQIDNVRGELSHGRAVEVANAFGIKPTCDASKEQVGDAEMTQLMRIGDKALTLVEQGSGKKAAFLKAYQEMYGVSGQKAKQAYTSFVKHCGILTSLKGA